MGRVTEILIATIASFSILGVFLYLIVGTVRALYAAWSDSRRKFPRTKFGTFGIKKGR